MRLAEFILGNIEPILAEWETFARSLTPGMKMTKLALCNDAEAILVATRRDMQIDQSLAQQASKSKGNGGVVGEESAQLDNASVLHGAARVGSGFDIMEVVSEYRALRASVLRLWRASNPQIDINDIGDITRFNESLDQSLAAAVGSYTIRVDQSRRMFLAILGHDLRDPLNGISMAAQLVSRTANQDPVSAKALSIIERNMEVVTRLISDLIDFASTGIGSVMPLTRDAVDLEKLCRNVFEGFCLAYPQRTLRFQPDGDLIGDCDAARLRQVVSNLMGNAIQHGSADGPVKLSVASEGSTVIVSVHNEGPPIPSEMLDTIFDPLMRHTKPESTTQRVPGSVGLGLYIVREIVVAHGGTVEVASTAEEGTTFAVRLPRSHPIGVDSQQS
ncbi:HAMP domain-containing sensor histidine kinase [Leptolyngbya sp. CCNP1308]|uniref:sensor histidine kinase n=1 Tax=Leptolyngbya sp. CCNP1308 TaxID=3110255 RepID=UPI002B211C86|nr:HAMP domain-containing sensor histidine kinase [Leptolyngbya sp. CCNP1308]MEA5448249.1 HAMP domain-containing sensor histidine kinase [Leptolyngbya sp. CCNP1308]